QGADHRSFFTFPCSFLQYRFATGDSLRRVQRSIGDLNRVFYPRPVWEFGEERDGRPNFRASDGKNHKEVRAGRVEHPRALGWNKSRRPWRLFLVKLRYYVEWLLAFVAAASATT